MMLSELVEGQDDRDTAENLAAELQGTCNSFDFSDYNDVVIEILDELVFNCEMCGWWCEISEMSEMSEDNMICTDCEDDL